MVLFWIKAIYHAIQSKGNTMRTDFLAHRFTPTAFTPSKAWLAPIVLTTALAVTACGGSDSSSDGGNTSASFAGTYSLQLALTTNSCNVGVGANVPASGMTVTQEGRQITVGQGSQVLTGQVDEDNQGFATELRRTVNGTATVSAIKLRTTATPNVHNVTYSVTTGRCTLAWGGKGSKN